MIGVIVTEPQSAVQAAKKVKRPRSMRWKAYVVTWMLKVLMRIIWRAWALDVEVRNRAVVPKDGPCGIVGNHLSNLDPPLWGAANKRNGAVLAKADLWNSVLTGWLVRMRGDVPVERGSDEGRARAFALIDDIYSHGGFGGGFPEGGIKRKGISEPGDRWNKGMFEIFIARQMPFVVVWLGGTDEMLPSTKADKAALMASRPKWLRWLPAVNLSAPLRMSFSHVVTPEEYAGMDAIELAEYARKLCYSMAFE